MRGEEEERFLKKPRREDIQARLIQFAAVQRIVQLDKEYSGKVELTLEGENRASQTVTKFCPDTAATESVANLNNFSSNNYQLADATTLYPLRNAI